MKTKNNSAGLDYFRIPAALLVVAIHTSPLASWSAEADFFLTRVLARIAVPFFFMVTGQFVAVACFERGKRAAERIGRYLAKLLLLYGAAIILYLPIGLYAGHYKNMTMGTFLRMLLFDGTFYHLWYFPACILGIVLVRLLGCILSIRQALFAAGFLYLFGLFGDSYFGLTQKLPVAAGIYEKGFDIWSYTRNGIFMAPVFLILGILVGRRCMEKKEGRRMTYVIAGFLCSFLLMTIEAFTLRHFALQRHDSMYVMLIPAMIFFYELLCILPAVPGNKDRRTARRTMEPDDVCLMLRSIATVIYILHPAIIVVVRGFAKVSGITILRENSLLYYLSVVLLSGGGSIFDGSLTAMVTEQPEQGKAGLSD